MSFVRVDAPNVKYTEDGFIVSDYTYHSSRLVRANGDGQGDQDEIRVAPVETKYTFRTNMETPKKFGLLLVGWGGNNGSTVTAGVLANRLNLSWRTRNGIQKANFFGSLTQASTLRMGIDHGDVIPFHRILPMINPREMVIGGWDINGANLAEAMRRAEVLEPDLQRQLEPLMAEMVPMKSIYYPDFIAANQKERADNLMAGDSKRDHLQQIRRDIRKFKTDKELDSLVVIWTANTERYAEILAGVNDTADSLLRSIEKNHPEISPSTIFAVASILEGVPFVNGSPQNTFVPGCMELAQRCGVFIGGDDFKTGQTKLKSVLVDFLVGAGIKPLAITSYNHLGNNDGRNLSAPQQFRSKEISKSNVVDDMVESNPILYAKGEKPDHVVVIKYVPAVADSKRALDEYYNEIFLGGRSTIAIHNTCEDSLLAAPLIIDLAIVTELFTRISYKTADMLDFAPFHSVLSVLSYLLKAPLVPDGAPVVNALFRQRQGLENILRACAGLPPQNDMMLEWKACSQKGKSSSGTHPLPRIGSELA